MTHSKTSSSLVRPTRRAFLGTTAAAAGLAGAGTLLGVQPLRAQSRGGAIRVAKGHGSTSDTLDPGTYENGFMLALTYGVHGFLTGFRRDGTLEPLVAESWEASPDAAVWRFKIRSGMTFHNGKSVTPEDVVASINYHRGEDTTSAAKPLLEAVTEISIDGDTVVFSLKGGNADFPTTFTDYHMAICPVGEQRGIDWRSGVGCGPYKLVEFDPGVVARFERFTDDWNQERGFFDTIEMLSIIDLNARTTALVSGDVHLIDKLDLKTAGLLGRQKDIKIHSIAGNQHYTFPMHCDVAPFDNVNVRRALKYGINRQEMVDKILFGYGSVGNDHPIGRGQRYFNDELEQTTYDPDKAKFYLKEAGLDSLNIDLSAADAAFAGAVDAAILYQNSVAAAGITLNVKRVPNDGYWSDVWLKHPFCACYWGGRPTEDGMFTTAYAAGAAWNDSRFADARFNELLVTARAELDDAKRRQMYYEMQAILNQDGGTVIPMFANYVFATGPGIVTGDNLSSHWDVDGERWMERWAFA
ncbi:ABC transporter substrate-binding protein [Aliiruegeria sabulilitoris]|uniref:ABC transporter substrate-binding protein n=1 Tax=Aliiruegeria sabulilitoris TaxID=1510458 RepID=UPI00083473CB|nr:ABC transporter substrate-binding protein [Aliiruegeria sabulilitoris]NDR58832.1 ABC transporter substrate-binding protein [Pseudoruegeria sp. M32A2M]